MIGLFLHDLWWETSVTISYTSTTLGSQSLIAPNRNSNRLETTTWLSLCAVPFKTDNKRRATVVRCKIKTRQHGQEMLKDVDRLQDQGSKHRYESVKAHLCPCNPDSIIRCGNMENQGPRNLISCFQKTDQIRCVGIPDKLDRQV